MATTDRRGVAVDSTDSAIRGSPNPGLAIKAPCRVATTGNINLHTIGLGVVDGLQLADGDRVLVWQQTDQTQNGLYNASSGVWPRTIDAKSNDLWANGMLVAIDLGTLFARDLFQCQTLDPIALGTSHVVFGPINPIPTSRRVDTTAPLAGGGALASDLTLSLTIGATLAVVSNALRTVAMTGDVTTPANSFVTTIAANAVTYAKLQQVAAVSLVGNPTGALANAQGITLGATLAFSGTALQTAAHTGDVTTAANSFATTIASHAVTNAKFRQGVARSLVGVTGNATADVADIAGTANQIPIVNNAGTALAFTTVSGDLTNATGVFTIAAAAVSYAKIQNVAATRLLGNPTGGATSASEISLGATLAFSGTALQTAAHTGDVTTSANSFATTVAKIAGTTVSGTTGTVNAVFSNSPTLVTPVLGTATATKITAANGTANGFFCAAASGTAASFSMGAGGNAVFVLGSAADGFQVNDHASGTVISISESTPGTTSSTVFTFAGQLYGADIATTASAANAFINTGSSPAGQLMRSTSSLIYKRDVESLDPAVALKVLSGAKPIWYRSKCAADNPAWSYYGLGAEDMAAVDPRLVHFGYQDDDYEDVSVPDLDRGEPFTKIVRRRKAGATLKPDGVQYERLVPHLVAGWQAHDARLAALESRIH